MTMMEDCNKYANVIKAKGDPFTKESLFIALILEQQKMIKELITKFLVNSESLCNRSLYFNETIQNS